MNKIVLNGREIVTQFMQIELSNISFWKDNPRIYSLIKSKYDREPSNEEIFQVLWAFDDHVRELVQQIKQNNGLIEPILVKKEDNKYLVYEGNSRFAAYLKLSENDPVKWGRINCNVLPEDLTDSDIFKLIGQFHIHSKKDWVPYEQAGYLYRRHCEQGLTIAEISNEMMLSQRKVKSLIEVYEFMIQNNINNIQKWSYFDEYLKSPSIRKIRKKFNTLDEIIVNQVASDTITNAVDIRNKLGVIARNFEKKPKHVDRTLKLLVEKNYSLDDAFKVMEECLTDNKILNLITNFKISISESGLIEQISRSEKDEYLKIKFELNKVKNNIEFILKKMDKSE